MELFGFCTSTLPGSISLAPTLEIKPNSCSEPSQHLKTRVLHGLKIVLQVRMEVADKSHTGIFTGRTKTLNHIILLPDLICEKSSTEESCFGISEMFNPLDWESTSCICLFYGLSSLYKLKTSLCLEVFLRLVMFSHNLQLPGSLKQE